MGLSPHPRSARPRRGRSRPPALVPRPSLNPSDPQQPQPSRDPTPLHPPDPAGPSRKHSPAGRKSARSSGLASLCPAHAPPLASRASALALSTLFLIPFQAPPDSLQKNKRSSGDAVVFSTVEDFFQAPYVPQNSPKVSTLPAGRRFVTPEREEVARPRGPQRAGAGTGGAAGGARLSRGEARARPQLPRAGPEGGGERARSPVPEPLWPRGPRTTPAGLRPRTPPVPAPESFCFFFFLPVFFFTLSLGAGVYILHQAEDGGVESRVYSFRPPARLPGLPTLTAGKNFGESSTDLSSCSQAQGWCNCHRFLSQDPEM